jgi:hypothetical protein
LPSCAIVFIAGPPSASAVINTAVDFFMVIIFCARRTMRWRSSQETPGA